MMLIFPSRQRMRICPSRQRMRILSLPGNRPDAGTAGRVGADFSLSQETVQTQERRDALEQIFSLPQETVQMQERRDALEQMMVGDPFGAKGLRFSWWHLLLAMLLAMVLTNSGVLPSVPVAVQEKLRAGLALVGLDRLGVLGGR